MKPHKRSGRALSLDPFFGGSGPTLAAAEQLDRSAYPCEIDPLYADVIVERWQALSRLEAALIGKGRSFA